MDQRPPIIDPSLPNAQRPAPNAPHYRWAVVGMLWLICFFNYADRVAISSVFPILKAEYGFTGSELGIIGGAFTWLYALASPIAGHTGDRYSRKLVIIGGMYVWSLITGLTAVCSKFWHFVTVRATEGIGEAFYFPASMSLISDYHGPATRSRAIGFHGSSVYAGTIFGGALSGWMGYHWGWRSPFIFLGAAGILLGMVLYLFIREPRRNQAERELRNLREDEGEPEPIPMLRFLAEFCRTPTAVLLIVAFFGANFVNFVFLTWMPTFLNEKFSVNVAAAGLGATVFIQLASMVGTTLGGIAADMRVRRYVTGRIHVQFAAILLAAPFVFLCGYTRDLWTLVGAMTCYGLFKGMYDSNLTAAFYDVIAPARRSTATGLMNFLGWIGAGLGAFAVGYATDLGITMSVAISSTAIVFVGVALVLLMAARFTAPRDIAARQRW